MPFCHGCIVAPLPAQPTRWKCMQTVPNELCTIGDHIKARRIQLHLFQSDVAKQIGVHFASVQNWERKLGKPLPRQIPAIIRFLCYVPFKHDGSIPGKLRWLRTVTGWTQDDWAAAARISPGTIARWEDGRGLIGSPRISTAIEALSRQIAKLGLGTFAQPQLDSIHSVSFARRRMGIHE